MVRHNKLITMIGASVFACAAYASSITIDSVTQRWPWNNKVDITYTVKGGQDVTLGQYARVVFTANIGGKEYSIDGVHDVGASAADGTHTVTWTAPSGLKASGCTMAVTLLSADVPSGDDYMIVNLDTGEITYEGLLSSQDASNARYNTAIYKTDRLVLRKVPKWKDRSSLPNAASLPAAGYPTGDNTNYSTSNGARTWQTDRDYYIGVFLVTQSQFAKIGADGNVSPSHHVTPENLLRPVEQVSWNRLRLPSGQSEIASTSSIPTVATSGSGNFFQRLNHLTGNRFGFDLPTEVMFEIAERAGVSSVYYWGDSTYNIDNVTNYVACLENSGSVTLTVGSFLPNAWGFYDMVGNVWEWCLDDNTLINLNVADTPFKPAWGNGGNRRARGASVYNNANYAGYRASLRNTFVATWTYRNTGFRIAMVVK